MASTSSTLAVPSSVSVSGATTPSRSHERKASMSFPMSPSSIASLTSGLTPAQLVRLDCQVLLDGSMDAPQKDWAIVFTQPPKLGQYGSRGKGVIVYVGPQADCTINADHHYNVPCVMPGLWDCHCHLSGWPDANFPLNLLKISPATGGARCAQDVRAALEAGVTSVRELGGLGLDIRDAIEDGTIPGPHIYSAGSWLSITTGHGDCHDTPHDFVCDALRRYYGGNAICDGVDECLKATRLQLRRGADCIKVFASGGVLSKRDHPLHAEFNPAEMKAIVDEAKSKERVVAAHCHGQAGIISALDAGCHTIEHGTYLDEPLMARMVAQGAILIPTLYVQRRMGELGPKMGISAESLAKAAVTSAQHKRMFGNAIKAGVPIACGTDIFTSGVNSVLPWGAHAKELELMVEAGMTPSHAIHAATAMGPKTLGPRAPRSGLLQVGYDADILAVAKNPLDDITILQKQANLWLVIKAGTFAVDRLPPSARVTAGPEPVAL